MKKCKHDGRKRKYKMGSKEYHNEKNKRNYLFNVKLKKKYRNI